MSSSGTPLAEMDLATIRERLREVTELLEVIAADRSVLEHVPDAEKKRLLKAVTRVNMPDGRTRRRLLKAHARLKRIEQVRREDRVLHETGIRTLRRKPVFNTPNVFPPRAFEPVDIHADDAPREAVEPQHCYVCKGSYSVIHHFYDQLCPECAAFNYTKRTELADLRGRVALLTGGRVKIGYQTGLKLLRSGAQLIVTTRFPRDSAARSAGAARGRRPAGCPKDLTRGGRVLLWSVQR